MPTFEAFDDDRSLGASVAADRLRQGRDSRQPRGLGRGRGARARATTAGRLPACDVPSADRGRDLLGADAGAAGDLEDASSCCADETIGVVRPRVRRSRLSGVSIAQLGRLREARATHRRGGAHSTSSAARPRLQSSAARCGWMSSSWLVISTLQRRRSASSVSTSSARGTEALSRSGRPSSPRRLYRQGRLGRGRATGRRCRGRMRRATTRALSSSSCRSRRSSPRGAAVSDARELPRRSCGSPMSTDGAEPDRSRRGSALA